MVDFDYFKLEEYHPEKVSLVGIGHAHECSTLIGYRPPQRNLSAFLEPPFFPHFDSLALAFHKMSGVNKKVMQQFGTRPMSRHRQLQLARAAIGKRPKRSAEGEVELPCAQSRGDSPTPIPSVSGEQRQLPTALDVSIC